MHRSGDSIQLSATDLSGHLNCKYLTELDIAVANGTLSKPYVNDPSAEVLAERGRRHELAYIQHLQSQGKSVAAKGESAEESSAARTAKLMATGADIIVQAALEADGWVGRADILQRVDKPSNLGDWSYEVADTKLARNTKGGSVLQLALYSELLLKIQAQSPEQSYIIVPGTDFEPESFRTDDYAAYYRKVKSALANIVNGQLAIGSYPDPKEHCEICRWRKTCDAKRHADDHLCLTANISKTQINELKLQGVATLSALSAMHIPLAWKPNRGSIQAYERIREQARIQVEGRALGRVIHELLTVQPGFGLCCLPAPTAGDIFLDLEGDPFVDGGGLEFLFGYAYLHTDNVVAYTADWALTRDEEKRAFETFVDFVVDRMTVHPDLHIYHYAPYEPAALKRLMGRYATREDEIDMMLRSQRFVDLYGIVRNSLRASVESYSIKKLEPLYGFTRPVDLYDAGRSLLNVQTSLELGDLSAIIETDRAIVQGYNKDDCMSNFELRQWLETCREELIAQGETIDRPEVPTGDASETITAQQSRINDLIAKLTDDVPVDINLRTPAEHGKWLLAYMLDWHRREDKADWWELFRLSDLGAEDLLDEKLAVSGLNFVGPVAGSGKLPTHRYNFPPQDSELRDGADVRAIGGGKHGKVEAISLDDRRVDIKKRKDSVDVHPEAIFGFKYFDKKVAADALLRIAEYVSDHGISGLGQFQPARDLLMREKPRIETLCLSGEPPVAAAKRVAQLLTRGVLAIQGPPGSGKTYTASRMICEIVRAGKKVGITANSHNVIRNLVDAVIKAADDQSIDLQCIEKVNEECAPEHRLQFTTNNTDLASAISGSCHVAAGTVWLWARGDMAEAVDVLFVDEAAQLSLANVLAVSQGARAVVLLGDPQQLDQPTKGSHPDGTEVSALDHILNGDQTIADDCGLFLGETWRLHPDICGFTSELFYESRLQPRAGNDKQRVKSASCVSGTGLRFRPVQHEGNQSSCPEEAAAIKDLFSEILLSDSSWVDREAKEHLITLSDILVMAPYNAQVFELQSQLPPGARVGTVDKFQGQEAPIVIYSMTTSTHAEAPRGMEFLYSLNRLNVATSRARCICILVASPAVFEAECRTPRQMKLANAFCRYLELATVI